MVEVADVLADEGLAFDDQRDRVLQVGPDREDRQAAGIAATACGANPRARRNTAAPYGPERTTESSMRRAIGRSPDQERVRDAG